MSKSKEFSKAVIDELGYYVYIYSDPDTRIPFYIGKGKGNRVFNHLSLDNDSDKVKKIQEIKAGGKEPIIEILVHNLFFQVDKPKNKEQYVLDYISEHSGESGIVYCL